MKAIQQFHRMVTRVMVVMVVMVVEVVVTVNQELKDIVEFILFISIYYNMSLFINTNLEIVFISIPKCASEYMEIILSKYGFKNHSNTAIVQHKSNGLNNYIKYVSDNGLSDFYDSFLTNYKFFTVVRNPYERFLSGFLYCYGKPFYIKEKELLPEFQEGLRSTHMSLDNNTMINFVSLDEAIQNKNNLYNLNIFYDE
jgi:hypothetical protein